MTEPAMLRAFVNGVAVQVAPGATVLDAVRAADPAAASEVLAGTRAIADSRGLVIDCATPATGGAVLRIVSSRAKKSAPAGDTG